MKAKKRPRKTRAEKIRAQHRVERKRKESHQLAVLEQERLADELREQLLEVIYTAERNGTWPKRVDWRFSSSTLNLIKELLEKLSQQHLMSIPVIEITERDYDEAYNPEFCGWLKARDGWAAGTVIITF